MLIVMRDSLTLDSSASDEEVLVLMTVGSLVVEDGGPKTAVLFSVAAADHGSGLGRSHMCPCQVSITPASPSHRRSTRLAGTGGGQTSEEEEEAEARESRCQCLPVPVPSVVIG